MANVLDPDSYTCARPFLSAAESLDWQNRNCCLCSKANWDSGVDEMPCDIQAQLSLASLCAGRVPLVVLERAGFDELHEWTCKEIAPVDERALVAIKQRGDVSQRKMEFNK